MTKSILVVAVAAAGLCSAHAGESKKQLGFAGCSISQVAYMKDMAKAFEAKSGVPVDVKGGGVPVGIRKTLDGKVELGGSCRHLLPKETDEGAVSTVVGYDMLVLMVDKRNPVDSLTMDQIRKIFSGKIGNWKQVGGPDQAIEIVGRESDDAGVATMFREKVMRGWEITKNSVNLPSTGEVEKAMHEGQHPWGIGVSGISSAALRDVKLLKLNIINPDREGFRKGTYPLVRPLYLVTKGKPEGLTKDFIDFVLSDEGQRIMAKNAFSIQDYCDRAKTLGGNCTAAGK